MTTRWLRLTSLVGLLLLCSGAASVAAELTLVQDGKPAATLVIAQEATKSAQFAAYELQWHVQRITGATLPLVTDNVEVTGTRILIGESAATRALGFKTADFKSREYMVHFLPDALVLMGCDQEDREPLRYEDNWGPEDDPWDKNVGFAWVTFPKLTDERGSMFAVYEFLERCCDVRWYRPGELGLSLPSTQTLSVAPVEIRRTPWLRTIELGMGMETRSYDDGLGLWGADPGSGERHELYDALAWEDIRQAYQGQRWEERKFIESRRRAGLLYLHRIRSGGEAFACNHAFYGYYARFWDEKINPQVFEAKHPEYFAQGYEGQPPQMCYTNPGFIAQVIQDARDYFDGKGTKPGAMAAGDVFGVGPMDNRSWCKCPRCQAQLDQEEMKNPQFNNGVASDYLFGFANTIARAVAETHPGKMVALMAYAAYAKPPKIALEPNVAVMLCLHGRNVYNPKLMEHDNAYLKAWADCKVPLYLWLYYCYPQYAAAFVGTPTWNAFPGFFAHAADKQIKLYAANGVRGIFTEGLTQDVDEYVVLKLFDDPTRDVDQILDEYFTRHYGAAAAPMKELYLKIEETYSNPANYPEGFAGHQKQEVAWGVLGTEERMAEFGQLMAQAYASAQTELEEKRVRAFDLSIWQHMVQGRRQYLAMEAHKANPLKLQTRIMAPKLAQPVPEGDPNQVDWSQAASAGSWHTLFGEPSPREFKLSVAYDDHNLYLQVEDPIATEGLTTQRALKTARWVGAYLRGYVGDYWRFFFARSNTAPRWASATTNEGLLVPAVGDPYLGTHRGAKIVNDTSAADRWVVRMAIPLKVVLTDGLEEGDGLYFNAVRHCSDGEVYSWLPMFEGLNRLTGLGVVHLDPPVAVPPPTTPAAARTFEGVPGTTVEMESLPRVELSMATDDALQARPFVVVTPQCRAHTIGARPPVAVLTDAKSATAPIIDFFVEGAPETVLEWDLGPVPPEGRQLRQLKLWRTLSDGARSRANVKFAIRDANTQAWRDVTEYLKDTEVKSSATHIYRLITVTFPEGEFANFDAFRMYDGAGLAEVYPPRLIELDVFTTPE